MVSFYKCLEFIKSWINLLFHVVLTSILFLYFFYCKVSLHDPDSLEICHTLEAHTAALSHFDIGGNLLATCGFSSRYLDRVKYLLWEYISRKY